MAGTPEKVLEHLLETRMNTYNYDEQFNKESLFEDFLLTFPIFISWKQMVNLLLRFVLFHQFDSKYFFVDITRLMK